MKMALAMIRDFRARVRAALHYACAVAALTAGAAHAQDAAQAVADGQVNLRSRDGTVEVSGRLLRFEDGIYYVETPTLGVIEVSSDVAACTGAACPRVWTPQLDIATGGDAALVAGLLSAYARSVGSAAAVAGDTVTLNDPDGTLRAEITLRPNGLAALADQTAAFALSDRRLTDDDLPALAAGGIGDLRGTPGEIVLAEDAVAVIVNPDNPVRSLSPGEFSDLWTGAVANWQALGGDDVPVTVHTLGLAAEDRRILLDIAGGESEAAEVHPGGAALVEAVLSDPGGIGFADLSAIGDARPLALRESCGLAAAPSAFAVKAGIYPLVRPVYLYRPPGAIHPEARAILDWLASDAAQPAIAAAGLIDHTPARMRLEDMGMALIHTAAVEPDFDPAQYTAMMRELRFAERLSTVFRFEFASSTLDVKSVRVLEDFARQLEAGDFDGYEVLLVGFTDAIGTVERNTRLAQARAEEVRDIVAASLAPRTLTALKLTPLSFGELLPLSCNTTDAGRERNRRVEVWLRRPGAADNTER